MDLYAYCSYIVTLKTVKKSQHTFWDNEWRDVIYYT